MNARTALAAALFMLVLLGAAWLLLKPPAEVMRTDAAPSWLESLDPSAVRGIRVEVDGGRTIHVVPSPVEGVWTMHDVGGGAPSGRDPATLGTGWPVSTARVRGFVRLIADFAKAAPIEAGPTKDTTGVVLTLDGKVERRFHVGKAELGGRVRVMIEDGEGVHGRLVDANMARLFQAEGLMAWREMLVFPSLVESSTQITLTHRDGSSAPQPPAARPAASDGATLKASKVQGRWALVSPVRAGVDEKVPAGTLLLAARASARQLVEPPPPEGDTGLGEPSFIMKLEQPANVLVNGEVKRRVLLQTLERGWKAEEGASYARARATLVDLETGKQQDVWGPMVVIMGDEHFSGLALEPSAWISRIAAGVPMADVRRIEIVRADASSEVVRTVDGWKASDERTSTDQRDDIRVAGALLAWLCTTPAMGVEVIAATDPNAPADGAKEAHARIRLYGPGGPDLPAIHDFTLTIEADGAGPVWRLREGNVARLYRGPVAGLEKAGFAGVGTGD
jgi:hypothetical protein